METIKFEYSGYPSAIASVEMLPIYCYITRLSKKIGSVDIRDMQIVGISRKLCNLINCEPAEIIRDTSVYFSCMKHEKVLNLNVWLHSAKVGAEFTRKVSTNVRGKSTMIFFINGTVTNVTDDYVEWCSCLTDVTELQASGTALDFAEERLESALGVAEIGIWEWSREAGVKANEIAWKLISEKSPHSSVGFGLFAKKIHPNDRNQFVTAIKDLFLGNSDDFIVEVRAKVGNEFQWFIVCGKVMQHNVNSKFERITGIIRNVSSSIESLIEKDKMKAILSDLAKKRIYELETELTHVQHIKERLLDDLRQERELSNMQGVFVNMASHEFRTPLAIIQMAADLLSQHYDVIPPGERAMHFDAIRAGAKRIACIMDYVFILGKVQDGKLPFNPQETNIIACLQHILAEVELAQNSHRIIFTAGANLPYMVSVDQSLLYHIISNLLNNALKYSSKDSNVILKLEYDSDALVIKVRDSGIGILQADMGNLFKLFHRGTNVGNRKGLGIGMFVVNHCVTLHKGTIEVFSEENVGTTFRVTIPIV